MPLIRSDSVRVPAASDTATHRTRLVAGDTEQRWTAARALGAAPGDVTALGAALAAEADPRIREAILTSLARAGGRESIDAILPHLRSDDARLRTGALDALCAMPAALQDVFAELLADPDPDVRLLACELARHLPGAGAETLLCDLLDREPQVNVCAAAVEVLAEIGTPTALPAMARCGHRFAGSTFLDFSVRMASDRIAQTSPGE